MTRAQSHLIGMRAYHRETDVTGIILDVHMNVQPQTAKFLPDGWEEERATWVNLVSLKLMPASDEPRR